MLGIYCVDDEMVSLTALDIQMRMGLDESKYVVELIDDSTQVLEVIKMHEASAIRPFLMITDYYMPLLNGDVLTRQVKAAFPAIQVIVLSGNSNIQAINGLVEDDLMCAFIGKPWKRSDLITALNRVLPPADHITD